MLSPLTAPPAPFATLGITLGDPTGIGPEIVLRALHARHKLDVVVFGEEAVLRRTATRLALPWPARARIETLTSLSEADSIPGQPNVAAGQAQVAYLQAGVEAALGGRIAGLVTAPISKTWAGRAGFSSPGHTEFLAEQAGVSEFAMMLAGPRLRVTVATRHLALAEVKDALSGAAIETAIVLTAQALHATFGLPAPRVAVAGLNPHAGENGRFGDEEETLIAPAIRAARTRLAALDCPATVTGPHVPDSVFREAACGGFDVVVAMYHDQGLIPVKLLDFDDTVNVTLGLPFVRTSPDHGTAYDLAASGGARADSFIAALDLAARLTATAAARRQE